MKAAQYIYRLSDNKAIVATYHATPHKIGYVTHDKLTSICINTYLMLCPVSNVNQHSLLFVIAPLTSRVSTTKRKFYNHVCH